MKNDKNDIYDLTPEERKQLARDAIALIATGEHNVKTACAKVGLNTSTFNHYRREYPELKKEHLQAKAQGDATYDQQAAHSTRKRALARMQGKEKRKSSVIVIRGKVPDTGKLFEKAKKISDDVYSVLTAMLQTELEDVTIETRHSVQDVLPSDAFIVSMLRGFDGVDFK